MTATVPLNRRRVTYANKRGSAWTYDFNCWGATLFVLNQRDRLKWVECHEMKRWLDTHTEPIYRPRKRGDVVMVMRWGLEHTAVYIGNGLYFHKRGPNTSEITNLKGIRKIYSGSYYYRRMIGTQNV